MHDISGEENNAIKELGTTMSVAHSALNSYSILEISL